MLSALKLVTKEHIMPRIIPQDMKAISTINAQPDRMTSKIHLLVLMDIAGATGNQMSEHSGMTPARISVIRNSPLFVEERNRKMIDLQSQTIDKKSTAIAKGDPVEERLKELASQAVGVYADILTNGKSEAVKKVTADSVLDRAGYKPHTEKMKVSIEVTEKMSDRFEEVLKYDTHRREASFASALELGELDNGPSENDRKTTVSIKTEMSE